MHVASLVWLVIPCDGTPQQERGVLLLAVGVRLGTDIAHLRYVSLFKLPCLALHDFCVSNETYY